SDEEVEPRVKLMDLSVFQRVNDIQGWIREHMQAGKALPKDVEVYPGIYAIDYAALNRAAPNIQSMFSGQTLEALVDVNGAVYIDYGIDIMQFIMRNEVPQ